MNKKHLKENQCMFNKIKKYSYNTCGSDYMNFFSNIPSDNQIPMPIPNNYHPEIPQNLFYKINELEDKIRRLEQRISRLEHENNDSLIPDNSLYMI